MMKTVIGEIQVSDDNKIKAAAEKIGRIVVKLRFVDAHQALLLNHCRLLIEECDSPEEALRMADQALPLLRAAISENWKAKTKP